MPGRDGTGPVGTGNRCGLGMAFRRGFGSGTGRTLYGCRLGTADRKEILEAQRNALKARLEEIDRELDNN